MKELEVNYRGEKHKVQVDDEDAERISRILDAPQPSTNSGGRGNAWVKRKRNLSYVPAWKNRGFRPAIWTEGKLWYLSRWLLGVADPKQIVDHIDQNPLNNQRCNLRIVGRKENSYNSGKHGWERPNKSSKYRGVIWSKQCKRWQAFITISKNRNKSSFHVVEEDAARARDAMLIEFLGVNDCLNFPEK